MFCMLTLLTHFAMLILFRGSHLRCAVSLQITLQSWFFLAYLMDSLAIAANGLVADNLGRGDMAAARAAALRCLLYGSGASVVLLGSLATFPQAVAAIFTDSRCSANFFTSPMQSSVNNLCSVSNCFCGDEQSQRSRKTAFMVCRSLIYSQPSTCFQE